MFEWIFFLFWDGLARDVCMKYSSLKKKATRKTGSKNRRTGTDRSGRAEIRLNLIISQTPKVYMCVDQTER